MLTRPISPRTFVAVLVLWVAVSPVSAQWPQWGGPDRDFTVETSGLADSWPDDGPKKLWHRRLGAGYSSVVFDDGMLFTMYRTVYTDEEERTVALDAKTGKTIWEHVSRAPHNEPPDARWGGQGPNSTPLIVGNRLYTAGSNSVLRCFNMKDGRVLWEYDLANEGKVRENGASTGYSPSPVAYKNMVIVTADQQWYRDANDNTDGGPPDPGISVNTKGKTLMALDQLSGSLVWKGLDYETGFGSPILINFAGQDQLVLAVAEGVIGVNPSNGELLWHYPVSREHAAVMTPMWLGDGLIFQSWGDAETGSRVIRLAKEGGKFSVDELWQSRKIRFIQSNPVRVGGNIIGSSGNGPALVMGVNANTGKRLWVKRGFDQAAYVHGDGKTFFLDWNGNLVLATATSDGLTIHSQCEVTERYSCTVPTLVGKTLYVRDRKHIMAFDLG